MAWSSFTRRPSLSMYRERTGCRPPYRLRSRPCACSSGSDDLLAKRRQLQNRLCLACWNPGEHGLEKLIPRQNPAAVAGISYFHPTGEAAKTYARNMEGWRDSYNFADLVLRTLEVTEYVEGLRVVKESGIKYGPFTEEGNIWDYYPYWHNWISFTLECGVVAAVPAAYENLL